MEVSISEASGLPPGAMLSIRAGNTRRQAPIPLTEPLRFPNLPFNAKQFKVDVLKPLGSARLDIVGQRAQEYHEVNIDLSDGLACGKARFGLNVREVPTLCGKRATELKQTDRVLREGCCAGGCSPVAELQAPPAGNPLIPPEKPKMTTDITRDYAREHNIPSIVQEMLHYVLRERPDAPFTVMANFMRRKAAEMEGAQPVPSAEYPSADKTMPVCHTMASEPPRVKTILAPSPQKAAAPAPMPDPDRLQLEAEHLALRAERAALLRELAELDAAATTAGFS